MRESDFQGVIMRKRLIIVIAFLLLACNLPNVTAPLAGPTPTPVVYVTVIVATPTAEPVIEKTTVTPQTTVPTRWPTPTKSPTATPSPTPTAGTPLPTRTPTLVPPGPPLGFADPAWELKEWHQVEETGEWEGVIKINIVGGAPPYRTQLEDQPIVEGNEVPARWRLCKMMPATVRVWSADGQEAKTPIWIGELGCQP